MITAISNATSYTWRKLKSAYHTAAFLSLAFVVFSVASGHVSGYLQNTTPLGTTVATADGTELSKGAAEEQKKVAKKAKTEQHADAAPLPGRRPAIPTPATPAQVGQ
jgi:hypothetical protein